MRGRRPTPAESELWQESQRDTRPLKPPRRPATASKAPAKPSLAGGSAAPPRQPSPRPKSPVGPAVSAPKPSVPPELSHGRMAGVDRRRADRLRRGQLAIEARIDLHGMTQAGAHARLAQFIGGAVAGGKRCVLVVTGIGRGESRGVLRDAVPRWLNEPALRPHVLGFDHAQLKDGGLGALYVLLRRQRESRR
jgi:DNA-nicking Smr family endonuclease